MKKYLFVLALLLSLNVYAQKDDPSSKFVFTELTFHSGQCNGSCPRISMNLSKNKRIQLSRRIYKSNGQVDTILSGNFVGSLNNKEFDIIITLLRKIDWDTITFPNVLCCDMAIRSILISYNGRYKKFRSMTPPQSTHELIQYLTKLCSEISLPKYNQPLDFESL